MDKKEILIVEDEVAIADDLQDILEIAGFKVIGIAFTYDQSLTYLESTSPDLVMLDIELKGPGSGLDIAKVINKKYQIPFIFLTSHSDQQTIADVIALNPEGYLIKPFKERDIAPAVALGLANSKKKKKEIFPALAFINDNIEKALSAQEYKVLQQLWDGKKNAEIASELFVSINTVKTHVNNLYSKLEVKSRLSACSKIMNL